MPKDDLLTMMIYTAYDNDEANTNITPVKLSASPPSPLYSNAMPTRASTMEMTIAGVSFSWKNNDIMAATITG